MGNGNGRVVEFGDDMVVRVDDSIDRCIFNTPNVHVESRTPESQFYTSERSVFINNHKHFNTLAEFILQQMEGIGYSRKQCSYTGFAIQEAYENAHQHGHPSGIFVHYQITPGFVTVTIRDSGQGFNLDDIEKISPIERWKQYVAGNRPETKDEIRKGAGLKLMAKSVDELTFNARGNCVQLTTYSTKMREAGD